MFASIWAIIVFNSISCAGGPRTVCSWRPGDGRAEGQSTPRLAGHPSAFVAQDTVGLQTHVACLC